MSLTTQPSTHADTHNYTHLELQKPLGVTVKFKLVFKKKSTVLKKETTGFC